MGGQPLGGVAGLEGGPRQSMAIPPTAGAPRHASAEGKPRRGAHTVGANTGGAAGEAECREEHNWGCQGVGKQTGGDSGGLANWEFCVGSHPRPSQL